MINNNTMAKITISLMRELEQKVISGDISYSRMVEILNEQLLIDASKQIEYFKIKPESIRLNPQTKQLVEAARNYLKPKNTFEEDDAAYDALQLAVTAYEQSTEQQEAIAGEKSALEIWKEWCEKDISWTDAASGAMSEYASQQTAFKDQKITELTNLLSDTNKRIQEIQDEEELKDKQLQVQQSHIDDQDQLIFEQDKEIADLKENINRLIEAHMGAEKEVSELKAEVERLRKRPIVYGAPNQQSK